MHSGKFYELISFRQEGNLLHFEVRLCPGSEVYQAHFPGFPITPGACELRLVTELLSHAWGRSLALKGISLAKFLSPLFPEEGKMVRVEISDVILSGDSLTAKAVIADDSQTYARIAAEYTLADTCVIIPVYNNAGTLCGVLDRVRAIVPDVLVVDDGSTDLSEADRLHVRENALAVLRHDRNRGKGAALRTGLLEARRRGFSKAITLDADGQHFPEDLPLFLQAAARHPDAMLIGRRNLVQENMPGGNTFANRFSNFWFAVQTGVRLGDTQTGYRLYQLDRLGRMRWLTPRYEAELELLVFQCWKGVPMVEVPVRVYYAPEGERISHFRPFRDFARISLLNTVLCLAALVYGWPSRLFRGLFSRRTR